MNRGQINPKHTPLGPLAPETVGVDERTLIQRLSFSAEVAESILFFNKNNQVDGNWRRLLLKDSVLFLATVAQTDYRATHSLFLSIKKQFDAEQSFGRPPVFRVPSQRAPNQGKINVDTKSRSWSALFNQLLELLLSLFLDVDLWLVRMSHSEEEYPLKTFVHQQVISSLGKQLSEYSIVNRTAYDTYSGIRPPRFDQLRSLSPLWKEGRDTAPQQLKPRTDLVQRAIDIYYRIFGFYVQVIDESKRSFEHLIARKNSHPDTALFIAFNRLLEVYQQQMNRLTKRHLDFYYRKVLGQQPQEAVADAAYLICKLESGTPGMKAPIGCAFSGGQDKSGAARIFVTEKEVFLNQTRLAQVRTLRYRPKGNHRAPILSSIEKPNELKKTPLGQLTSWPLLGSENEGVGIRQGFCLASPLLYLQGGARTIDIKFHFDGVPVMSKADLESCRYFLSTKNEWLDVSQMVTVTDATENSHPPEEGATREASEASNPSQSLFCLSMKLDTEQPAIERFEPEAPDGFGSHWPLFKVMLSDSIDLTKPVWIKKVEITSQVSALEHFELYNDAGRLNPDGLFQPFGPMAGMDSHFFIGSTELFSKPLEALKFQVEWSKLPVHMIEYYKIYNRLVSENRPTKDQNVKKEKKDEDSVGHETSLKAGVREETNDSPLQPKEDKPTVESDSFYTRPFHNRSFRFLCGFYDGGVWKNADLFTASDQGVLEKTVEKDSKEKEDGTWLFYEDPPSNPSPGTVENPIIVESKVSKPEFTEGDLKPMNQYIFEKESLKTLTPDPQLIGSGLDLSENNAGFFSFSLCHPKYGFGHELYPKAVSYVTMQNAQDMVQAIVNGSKGSSGEGDDRPPFKPMELPNLPYVPTLKTIKAEYLSSQCCDLSCEADYPFELYHLDSLSSYPVYDSKNEKSVVPSTLSQSPHPAGDGTPHERDSTSSKRTLGRGIRLFPGISKYSTGCLYLTLTHIEPPCNLSFLVKLDCLVPLFKGDRPANINFYYLSNRGWKPLKILDDQTDNLRSSGIIEVFIDADLALSPGENGGLMPPADPAAPQQRQGWLALSGDRDQDAFPSVVFLDTQAIEVRRRLGNGEMSTPESLSLPADSIREAVTPMEGIESVLQPFASFGGAPHENEAEFLKRVSQRIAQKSRASTPRDIEKQAFTALPSLYYCKVLKREDNNRGIVNFAMVQGYPDIETRGALRPVVEYRQIKRLEAFYAKRISPFTRLEIFNFRHIVVLVDATLKFVANVPVNALCQKISDQLTLYLSPWVASTTAQRDVDSPLSMSQLVEYFNSFVEVQTVTSMDLYIDGEKLKGDRYVPPEDAILVSAVSHRIAPDTNGRRIGNVA